MDPSASLPCPGPTSSEAHDEHHYNQAAFEHSRQDRNRRGWRHVVLNFTPSWFSVTMGTGIVSILLHNFPYGARWLSWISIVIFGLNVLLFSLFTAVSIVRYTVFRGIWSCMLRHPVQSLFLGTIPMGLATIINMVVFICVPAWGSWATTLAWTLWWVDVVLAMSTNLYLPFIIMYKHESNLNTMTAAWLLPIVATIVAAASGAVVADALPNDQHALWTIIISYILWGCGISMAMFTLAIYFHRLTLHALPPREVIVSVFLPLGPFGQGAFAIMQLGADSLKLFERMDTIPAAPMAGQILYTFGLLAALIMWGSGLVWLFFALASITRSTFPFNLGWWGFTFPLGVFAVATTTLAKELPSPFFRVLGSVFSLVVVILWAFVSVRTLRRSVTGELFMAPCLKDWEAQQARKRVNGDVEANKE